MGLGLNNKLFTATNNIVQTLTDNNTNNRNIIMRTMKQQCGASFTSWLLIIMVGMFLGVLGLKAIPLYIEYYEVRSLIDSIATDSSMQKANKRMINVKLGKYLDMNSLGDHLSPKDFEVKRIKGTDKERNLSVEYEVRTPWFGNLDFVAKFDYKKRMGSVLD